jgi:prepilin-type N-terminal cleavage/methylation domain-containing protein
MKKGFTLIELMVVISIIGILAAIATVSYSAAQKQARDTQRKSDLDQYRSALESFANTNNGLYPGEKTAVSVGTVSSGGLCDDLNLATCPSDPKTSYNYMYQSDGSSTGGTAVATRYALWATLENVTGYWIVCSNGTSLTKTTTPSLSDCP